MYNLPNFDFNKIKNNFVKTLKSRIFWGVLCLIIAGCIVGSFAGVAVLHYFPAQTQAFLEYFKVPEQEAQKSVAKPYVSEVAYEQAIIDAAKNVSPSVVSIVISKNVPVYEQQWVDPFGDNNPFGDLSPFSFQIPQQVQNGTKYQEVGAGSGFIVSADGLVLTNKHVVLDNKADYTVFTSDGQKYSAKVLALDPVQDLAVIKISRPSGTPSNDGATFHPVILGDSSGIQIGQTAIAIGNALGQFSNTVSVGVVSGLQRTISASDQVGSFSETLEGIIQTDAAINAGNSGGPLLNLRGEVIGINTATAQGAQSIGFAIPIDSAKKAIGQVISAGKIVYPFLGVRYTLTDKGAVVAKGDKGEPAITKGSAAEKAGIKAGDVIMEINGEKITTKNSMAKIIQEYNVGDTITLHILRGDKELDLTATLGERSS